MNFSCDRCQKRFSTSEELVPGRPYRIRCACGNMIVLEMDDLDPAARHVDGEPAGDDPFARETQVQSPRGAVAPAPAVIPMRAGRLARRDPYAASEESAEYRIPGAVSFDDMLRRARRQGFVAGSVAGALGGLVISAAAALLTSRPVATVTVPVLESRVEAAPHTREAARDTPGGSATTRRTAIAMNRNFAAAAAPRHLPETPTRESVDGGEALDPSRPAAAEPAMLAPTEATAPARQLDEREVAAALRARRDAFDACVAATSGDAASARGHRFRVSVVIEPSGQVSDARIDDPQIDATPLGACLIRLAQTMSFAPFDGEPVRVEVPLRFGNAE
jgi:hypothetical protein